MHDPLAPLLADGVIDEICARLKSGKEADLWLVRHGGEMVAAKVYKARQTRSFKNDAAYKEGRQVRNTRTQRAMDRGSRFGQASAEEAWKAKEADALHALHAAGVRVPRPVLFYEGVLLMELVVDTHGHPAPRLIDARVPREQAAALYADLRAQAVRILGCDLIHGDLSPYNVLVGSNGPVVIDFPQVVGAAHNSQAEAFFLRDVENLRRFFEGIDPALRAASNDAREIWRAYVRRELTPDFVPTGKAVEMPPPRREHGRPERPHHGRTHETPSRGGSHARHASGAPAPAPGRRGPDRRGPDRRRGGAAPEVIRVARPPLVAAAQRPATPGRAPPVAPPAHGARHAGDPRPHADPRPHGRRRRRRRG